jgi:hypothetical protein
MSASPHLLAILDTEDPGHAIDRLKTALDELRDDERECLVAAFALSRTAAPTLSGRRAAATYPPKDDKTAYSHENRAIDHLAQVLTSRRRSPDAQGPTVGPLPARAASFDVAARFRTVRTTGIWSFTESGQVVIELTRDIESLVDGLDQIPERYSGSGDARVRYRFKAEIGCRVEDEVQTANGGVSAQFVFTKQLDRGDRHLIRYRIERVPSAADLVENLRPFVMCFYDKDEPTCEETFIIRFPRGRLPDRLWTQVEPFPSRLGVRQRKLQSLEVDRDFCVQHRVAEIEPGMHYAVCWEWPNS